MKVGAQPLASPRMPSSLTVTLKPLPMDLYLSGLTCRGSHRDSLKACLSARLSWGSPRKNTFWQLPEEPAARVEPDTWQVEEECLLTLWVKGQSLHLQYLFLVNTRNTDVSPFLFLVNKEVGCKHSWWGKYTPPIIAGEI